MSPQKIVAGVIGAIAVSGAGGITYEVVKGEPTVQAPAVKKETEYTFKFPNKELRISCPEGSFAGETLDIKDRNNHKKVVICQKKVSGWARYYQQNTLKWEDFHSVHKSKPHCVLKGDKVTYECSYDGTEPVELKQVPYWIDGAANKWVIQIG
ncbi:hypothetical protein MHLP_01160 [Candidatus Mycoplasma haematolamae str. Purdue]|uniref:Ig-like domain-containing protein n=1 Tax=Mycoplasma haematolamae (strain Purdue) TaxID=1212765 RepID=I7C5M4_MYCHA|nr:hypothetical protein [Candidatus Mycoplasma haematolamae]AFO51812.1 hypothetical protein MHLP_01160 [Candidatus Mycoplasma haematolamae str. Purdue]